MKLKLVNFYEKLFPTASSNRLCTRAGYIAYPYDKRIFCYCSGPWKNAGCLRCPADLVYSDSCAQCLSVDDGMHNFFTFISKKLFSQF